MTASQASVVIQGVELRRGPGEVWTYLPPGPFLERTRPAGPTISLLDAGGSAFPPAHQPDGHVRRGAAALLARLRLRFEVADLRPAEIDVGEVVLQGRTGDDPGVSSPRAAVPARRRGPPLWPSSSPPTRRPTCKPPSAESGTGSGSSPRSPSHAARAASAPATYPTCSRPSDQGILMLQLEGFIDRPEATVYRDDLDPMMFYVLPKIPTLRRRNDVPVFKYVKYRSEKPLKNGEIGAGLVFMDIVLAIDAQQEQALREALAGLVSAQRGGQPVDAAALVLAKPQFTSGSVAVEISSPRARTWSSGSTTPEPSMYGDNVVAVSAELTQVGAPVFEAVMKSEGAGGVRVVYDLTFTARMPPVKATGVWTASRFYSFTQTVDFEENWFTEDDFNETVNELFVQSESWVVEVDPEA